MGGNVAWKESGASQSAMIRASRPPVQAGMRTPAIATLVMVTLAVVATALLAKPARVAAHPLGNFTISRYSRIELIPGLARVRYVVDMAEIPAFQERSAIDSNRDGRIDDTEADAYARRLMTGIGQNLRLSIDGRIRPLRLDSHAIGFPPGQGGLDTIRLEAWYQADLPEPSSPARIEYRDQNYTDRLGWKEIVVRGGPGIDVTDSTVSTTDVTDELRSYPDDMLQRPLDQRSAAFTISLGAGGSLGGDAPPATATIGRRSDAFSRLITRELTLPVFVLSMVVAMGLGAVHALGPGHGKTVVAAYLVGSRGTTKHAVFLGLTVTLTHTSSVFALGLVTLYLSDLILPEQLFPWLSFASGAAIAVLGCALLVARTRALMSQRRSPEATARPGAGAVRGAPIPAYAPAHSRMRHYSARQRLPQMHGHDHDGLGFHSHGGATHSHAPPGANGERITWRSLLALGISGGLLPCPSALVVLLTAISLHRVGYGMLLILAFSVGLAGVLTGIGLLLVHARGLFSRVPFESRLARILPIGSAAVVTVLGAAIAVRALSGESFPLM
jgi:nickel/cobalt exporter